MEHFVTHFNKLFLPQGLALHESLSKNISNFTLWIVCIDDETYGILKKLNLVSINIINLKNVETQELLKVKRERTIGEYCWTLTPFIPRFVFNQDKNIKRVTYLDADLFFLKNPSQIFEQFDKSGKEVLITEHSYSPEYDRSNESGQYCVQFMIFNRIGGEPVRKWWEEKCIEWCYNRHEDGKFGDQKYLDEWPVRFSSKVHVLNNPEWTLAPWNATKYQYSKAIFYHFHELKILNHTEVILGTYYALPEILVNRVYYKYLESLKKGIEILNKIGFKVYPQIQKRSLMKKILDLILGFKNNLWRYKTHRYKKF